MLSNQSTALARHAYEQVTNQEIVLIGILILLIATLRLVFFFFKFNNLTLSRPMRYHQGYFNTDYRNEDLWNLIKYKFCVGLNFLNTPS